LRSFWLLTIFILNAGNSINIIEYHTFLILLSLYHHIFF
jgi:hypothetical protein